MNRNSVIIEHPLYSEGEGKIEVQIEGIVKTAEGNNHSFTGLASRNTPKDLPLYFEFHIAGTKMSEDKVFADTKVNWSGEDLDIMWRDRHDDQTIGFRVIKDERGYYPNLETATEVPLVSDEEFARQIGLKL